MLREIGLLNKKINKLGFTLAEVLITLGIIGIIASMMIPVLMNNINEKQTAVKLKKEYSILTQAFVRAVQDDTTINEWGLTGWDAQSATIILNRITPYLKLEKNCGTKSGCWPGMTDDDGTGALILADGTLFDIGAYGICYDKNNASAPNPHVKDACAEFYVDVNGFKGPNQQGIDEFYFYVPSNGYITPSGVKDEDAWWYPFDTNCKNFGSSNGYGCTAWVLYNENEDYRHCSNLGWTGPTTCP